MKIISVTLLIAFSVFFFNVQGFGHDACQSQRDALASAKQTLSAAQKDFNTKSVALGLLYAKIDKDRTGPDGTQRSYNATELALIAAAGKLVADAGIAVSNAQKTVNSKQQAVNNCVKLDSRDCDNDGFYNDCSILHTQSRTSCECNCDYGAYGCECGSCSSYLNNN